MDICDSSNIEEIKNKWFLNKDWEKTFLVWNEKNISSSIGEKEKN